MRCFVIFVVLCLIPVAALAEDYICPMHPHIVGEHGDTCPICGFDLVPKVESSESADEEPEGAFHVNPRFQQALGVKTAEVSSRNFGQNIRAYGLLAPSSRLEYEFSMYEEGWVVDLTTDAVGDTVKKGDVLFSAYSPIIMGAQSDYFIAKKNGRSALVSEQGLRLVGMDNKAIALLKKTGAMLESTPFHAPMDGVVTALNVRQGAFLAKGSQVLTLQDFSKIWVNAELPLRDLMFVSKETPATVIVPETGERYFSTVDYIHPINDAKSRTIQVRLLLNNPEGKLKPETYVDVIFEADIQSRLAVPAESILYSSAGAYVIESMDGGFYRPVMVEVGVNSDGLSEITGGLVSGQRIVTSGQFMLDAESNLRGGMASMAHEADSKMENMDTNTDRLGEPDVATHSMEADHVQ